MIGIILQIVVLILSMSGCYLLASKQYVKWGYLVGFVAIPFWAAAEAYYGQWVWFSTNLYYAVVWYYGLKVHWSK
jgi:hypothetical protein